MLLPGLWYFIRGPHKGKTPALRQATDEEARKNGIPNDGEFKVWRARDMADVLSGKAEVDEGYHAINIHSGGAMTTSSWGCQTIPPADFNRFMQAVWNHTKKHGQRRVPYLLIDGPVQFELVVTASSEANDNREDPMLTASVGVGGVNRQMDVEQVQERLNCFVHLLELEPLGVDGDCGPKTRDAIRAFQEDTVGMETPDGRVDPGGRTWQLLNKEPGAAPKPTPHTATGPLATLLAPGPRTALTDNDFSRAASTLGCDTAAIRAVAKVECSRKAFDDLGRPTILYERHLFHRMTKGIFDGRAPDILNRESGGYGTFASQYGKLERAFALDEDAALKACSWGMFQILGQNHIAAGFATVVDFVRAMCQTEADHLAAFVKFIQAHSAMHQALQDHDWAGFAARYNGPQFHKNHYDERMAKAYREAGGH